MNEPLSFQEIILRLHRYWADHGCFIWQPHNVQVGAGTMNPATILRVLGPEPWNVAYIEPSVRADDSRYGENPNRFQQHIQYQVILKPDPGNPQELYLGSLDAIGIDREQHDIRFVEDNWAAPGLGAWGLGWEVWLDGLEITQFTYFQQAGGFALEPIAVELTYGLERIAMFLQQVDHFKKIRYGPGISYGEMYGIAEYEHSRYNLDDADIDVQAELFRLYETEAKRCIDLGLVLPAHDFVLKCSHTFNILDARGAVGVTERAQYFARMRDLARQVSRAFYEQRKRLEFPLLKLETALAEPGAPDVETQAFPQEPRTFVLEIGTEELPAGDVASAIGQLEFAVPTLLESIRLDCGPVRVYGTPRRLSVVVEELAHRQRDQEALVKGPPAQIAFDVTGAPTAAALGFARSRDLDVADLQVLEIDGGLYAAGLERRSGRPAASLLAEVLLDLIASISFDTTMRWNSSGVAFSRPIRWLLAVLGAQVIPFTYAQVASGRVTYGSRPDGSPRITVDKAEEYEMALSKANILLNQKDRRAAIAAQIRKLAPDAGGRIPADPDLLDEVTQLVECPTALLGRFEERYLRLPREVLTTVMRKHQRYFPVTKTDSDALLACFVTVRNGGEAHQEIVRRGNEEVIRARFADAEFFWNTDTSRDLEDHLPRLDTLTFQEQLGSMLDKTRRLEALVPRLTALLGHSEHEAKVAERAAHLCKADLVTLMVTDFTDLQGTMGREYALLSGEPPEVAEAIWEHYLPRHAGDATPSTRPGFAVGLANRFDSLCGLFAVGLAPSGSADPYHLRRDALGVVRSLIAQGQPFSVRDGLTLAAQVLPVSVDETTLDETAAFVRERLRGVIRDDGYEFDIVDAVLSERRGDDPFRAAIGVEELARWVGREDWPRILAAYSRCVRILRTIPQDSKMRPFSPGRIVEGATQELYTAYLQQADRINPDTAVNDFLEAFEQLVAPITRFFDEVLVMTENESLRANRLALLELIADLSDGIVDLSRLQGF